MKNRNLGCIDKNFGYNLIYLFIHWYTALHFRPCLWEHFTVHAENEQSFFPLTTEHTESSTHWKKSIKKFYEAQVSGTKGIEIKCLMIKSFFFSPFLFTPPSTPTHIAFQIIFTKGYFTKSAHIALSVIKMNCWCASVQKTNVQSQTALCSSPKECPQSDEGAYLWCVLTEFSADKEVQL